MGLRINTNTEAINALNSLNKTNYYFSKSLSKLSSGYRINVAADDPAGLVISEALRSQLAGLKQAVENSQNAANMISTVEGALIEMNSILNSVRQLAVHSANRGTADRQQVQADQSQVDSAIRSIDRIANTTKFAGKYLLNGSQGYDYQGNAGMQNVVVTRAQLYQGQTVSAIFNISTAATLAGYGSALSSHTLISSSTVAGTYTILVAGALGTEFINLGDGSSAAQIGTAINQLTANTGVKAVTSAGSQYLVSTLYGSRQFVQLEKVSGAGNTTAIPKTWGIDVKGTMNGTSFAGDGMKVSVNTSSFAGECVFSAGAALATNYAVTVTGGGMVFQLGERGTPNEQEYMGLTAVHSTSLGDSLDGYVTTMRTGGPNDLFTNPEQAITIIDNAINRVSALRAQLGSFHKNTLLTNTNSLGVSIENLTNSESRIRDANMAEEMTEFTKHQILTQTGTAMLAQANSASQSVLQLLK
jgi:flagellin